MVDGVACNLCGSAEWKEFAGRANAACARCGSLERTRLVYLQMRELGLPRPGSTILHVAPERGLARVLHQAGGAKYRPVDVAPQSYLALDVEKFDMCEDVVALETESIDLIVHNHVLEHIFCDVTSVILHLHRALKPGGYHLFSVPIIANRHFEEFLGPLSRDEAIRRFGQHDHCRLYGGADVAKKLGMMFRVALEDFIPSRRFSDEALKAINVPENHWRALSGNTVFAMRKEDAYFASAAAPPGPSR